MPPKEPEPGAEALKYDPSRVSWAVAEAVQMPPSSLVRLSLYMIVALLAGGVLYAHLTTITISATGTGSIRTSVKIIPVKTEVSGRVSAFNVKDNQRVKKGDVIAELENKVDEKTHEEALSIVKRLDVLVKEEPRQAADAGVIAGDIMRLDIKAMVAERSALAEAANALFTALRGVQDVGALSAADASERNAALAKIEKIKSQGLADSLSSELAELERTVARAGVAMGGRRVQAQQQLTTARSSLAVKIRSFEQMLEKHIRSQRILAPADGIATKVAVSGAGELVTGGQGLVEIIPEGGSLIAEVVIPNKDIADLKVGMPVDLSLDALPYQDFGTLPGEILEIPPDATVAGTPGALPGYLIKVKLLKTSLDAGSGPKPVILGMTLRAEAQIRQQTLLELGIRQVLGLKDKL